MARELSVALRLLADPSRLLSGLRSARTGVTTFGTTVKREFSELRRLAGTLEGRLAALGVSVGATAQLLQSARLDKALLRTGQTAGATRDEIEGLRGTLFRLARETGQELEDLRGGFDSLIQSGLSWRESLAVIGPINRTMAVAGANAQTLASGLTVAATAFQFDLTQAERAQSLLDRMVVAGRLGNAELENLSGIFARVGVNAAAAGFGFDQTLAFIEGLSMLERQPERLATLADSTLRLFTNATYRRAAQRATGVEFFTEAGEQRDPLAILRDLRAEFAKLGTDADRARFMSRAFGQTDLDTQRGLRTLLSGDLLDRIGGFTTELSRASGAVAKDLPGAIENAVDQVGRLKGVLREAADGFARPINDAISRGIRFLLDSREAGGLGLSGGQLLAGGAAAGVGTLLALRAGRGLLGRLGGRLFGTATGVAAGKALEAAAGVTPVFVVNWPATLGGGAGSLLGGSSGTRLLDLGTEAAGRGLLGRLAGPAGRALGWLRGVPALLSGLGGTSVSALAGGGASGLATLGSGMLAAGAAGWGIGRLLDRAVLEPTGLGDKLGEAITRALAAFGHEESRLALAAVEQARRLEGELRIRIDSEGRPRVESMSTSSRDFALDVDAGLVMVAP
ncbi:MAG TPA: phage tail tape measure protein [Thermodesulfobacteriota bacterium]